MEFNCPSCGAPFNSMGLPISKVDCPNCKTSFEPLARPRPRRSLYPAETEQRATELLAKINDVASAYDDGIRQCALLQLENEWLGGSGHKVTIKLGANHSVNDARCSVCGKDTPDKGFVLHIISRWRNTTTSVFLCDEHKETPSLFATDVDILENNICPRMGYA